MFLKAAAPERYSHRISNHVINLMTPDLTVDQALAVLADPATLRIMWVRNPYARLLSAFLDKVLGEFRDIDQVQRYGGPFHDSPSEFARFVRAVLDERSQGNVAELHWRLQTQTCGLQDGVKYHFYLKEEDTNTWYVELMSLFGLNEDVESGPYKV